MSYTSEQPSIPGHSEFSKEAIEAGSELFRPECTFVKGVVKIDGLPEMSRPEVAFAGRSNVGKSSLLNALADHKGLARTSNTPGRTKEINYFTMSDHIYLVDMPGYGYAKASKTQVSAWNHLIRAYLRGRASLMRVYLLIDSRHGPKKNDEDIMSLLDEAAVSYQAVLTKIDKLKRGELEKVANATMACLAKHPAAFPELIATSAEKKTGFDDLRASIAMSIGFEKKVSEA